MLVDLPARYFADPVKTQVIMIRAIKCERHIHIVPAKAMDIGKPDPGSECDPRSRGVKDKMPQFAIFFYEMIEQADGPFRFAFQEIIHRPFVAGM